MAMAAIRRRWALCALVVTTTTALLAVGAPAQAGPVWYLANLTALAGAPPVSTAPAPLPSVEQRTQQVLMAYTTDLGTQEPVARVVYRTPAGHVQELSTTGGGSWQSAQLTTVPDAAGRPFGYTTSLAGQGSVARVVYLTADGHIKELSSNGGPWVSADLTLLTGAPPAGSEPFGYTTHVTGEGQVARVVYMTDFADVQELSLDSGGTWHTAQLSGLYGQSLTNPTGYTTNLAGQGTVARVVYGSTGYMTYELSFAGAGSWPGNRFYTGDAFPIGRGARIGYATDLDGLGQVARVVYLTWDGRIQELSVVGGGTWQGNALTPTYEAWSSPHAYNNGKPGPGSEARLVYVTNDLHVVSLRLVGGQNWQRTDLTAHTGAPDAAFPPFAYATNLTGQGPVSRTLFVTPTGSIEEISTAG